MKLKLTKEQKEKINAKYKTPDLIARERSNFHDDAVEHWKEHLNDEYGDAADWAYENLSEEDLFLLLDVL